MQRITLVSKERFTTKLEKPIDKTPNLSKLFMKLSIKFCTQVTRMCLQKCLVFDFHLFAQIGHQRCEFQTVHKFQPINIRYLLNLHFVKKWLISNMLKHTRNTNNSGIRFYKQIYNE